MDLLSNMFSPIHRFTATQQLYHSDCARFIDLVITTRTLYVTPARVQFGPQMHSSGGIDDDRSPNAIGFGLAFVQCKMPSSGINVSNGDLDLI